jgi:S-adenosylmethionine decarboxylase
MFDMAPEVADCFFEQNIPLAKDMTMKSGIFNLVPGATIDEVSFSPCGYSMNAILHDAYSTIHITPEAACSYASFETNTKLRDYSALVRNVLTVFRPKRFVLTVFGDDAALRSMVELPTDPKYITMPGFGAYTRTSLSFTKVEIDLSCLLGCYSLEDIKPSSIPSVTSLANLIGAVPAKERRRTYSEL